MAEKALRAGAHARYTDVYVGKPTVMEDYISADSTPQDCRLRDMTYAAPISVDIEYSRGREVVIKKGSGGQGAVVIGRIPLMLRSDRCVLKGKGEQELARLGECPLDPGGYFVVKACSSRTRTPTRRACHAGLAVGRLVRVLVGALAYSIVWRCDKQNRCSARIGAVVPCVHGRWLSGSFCHCAN
jgi:RNA polymerase beta subunit